MKATEARAAASIAVAAKRAIRHHRIGVKTSDKKKAVAHSGATRILNTAKAAHIWPLKGTRRSAIYPCFSAPVANRGRSQLESRP